MTLKIKAGFVVPVLIGAIAVVSSCRRYTDPPPYFEENKETVTSVKRKVLFIGIDGAVGAEYKKIQAPVLEGMKAHSKYSWESVSDESSTDAGSWKTLLTGVSFAKHQISDSSFVYSQPLGGAEHVAPQSYPSFFNFILSSAKSDTRTTFVSSWRDLVNRVAPEVDDKVFGANDAAVKDSAVSRLKTGKSDIVIVHFNSVAIAGKASGFSATAQGYKDAVLQVDGFIGELMTGLKSRPQYNKNEEWLVIITGTHGGAGNSYGGASASEVNNFSFYYNENLKPVEFIRAGFTSVQLKNKDIRAQIPDDGGLYNPNLAQQTVSVKIKSATKAAYPHFFSKMSKFASTTGWSLFTNSAGIWCLSVIGSGESRIQNTTPVVFDDKWHTLTFKFMDSASKRWVVRYTDGLRQDITDVTARGSVSSTAPLTMGFGTDPAYNGVAVNFADCMIFNTALSDAEVASLVCMSNISQHPKYGNLIGYWPCNEGFGAGFRNNAPGAVNKDLILQGPYTWDPVADLPCTTAPIVNDPLRKPLLVKSVDMAATALYWLKIPALAAWGLEGSTWLSQYQLEFEKL